MMNPLTFSEKTSKKGTHMLTIIPNSKAMDYKKLIEFLNKRKNIELNRLKQGGNKNVKDIEYRINKTTNRPELLELHWNRYHYIRSLDQLKFHDEKYTHNNTIPFTVQELVANDILDLSKYMFLTHECTDDGFDMEIILHGIFATLEEAGNQELEDIVAVVPGDYINYTAYKEAINDEP